MLGGLQLFAHAWRHTIIPVHLQLLLSLIPHLVDIGHLSIPLLLLLTHLYPLLSAQPHELLHHYLSLMLLIKQGPLLFKEAHVGRERFLNLLDSVYTDGPNHRLADLSGFDWRDYTHLLIAQYFVAFRLITVDLLLILSQGMPFSGGDSQDLFHVELGPSVLQDGLPMLHIDEKGRELLLRDWWLR